jgi:hypothetical protein
MARKTQQDRREPEREQRQRESTEAQEGAIDNAPPHVQRRLGQPSQLGIALGTLERDAPKGERQFNAVGAKFDEHGQTIRREDSKNSGANTDRRDYRKATAIDLRARYPEFWGERGGATKIEAAEHRRRAERPKDEDACDYPEPPTERTIRRYIKDFPN